MPDIRHVLNGPLVASVHKGDNTMKRIALFALACTWLAACERPSDPLGVDPPFQPAPPAPAQGGPVILMGIDAEDAVRSPVSNHGSPSIYAGVVRKGILDNVTNGGTLGILGIGCGKSPTDDVTFFWTAVATNPNVMKPLVCVNGAAAISTQSFDGFEMIAVVSDRINTSSGGLTQAELDALNARDADVAEFVNTGGGLFGLSNCALTDPYGYLGGVGGFTCGALGSNQQDNIEPTPEGQALGITSTNLDVCCWHDTYKAFPAFLKVLAVYPDVSGKPAAAIGGAQVIVTQGITLEPATDENPAGTAHTVTATLENSEGNPVVDREVRFKVISGPNAGQASPVNGVCTPFPNCHTDNNGQVSWTYTSNGKLGTDIIEACFTDDRDVERCAQATKEWVVGPPATLLLTPPFATNTVGAEHCVTATVRDAFGNPVPGVTVRFSVGPSVPTTFPSPASGSATTDANGQAKFCYTASLPGVDRIHAFADTNGDATEQPTEPSGNAEKTWTPPPSTQFCEVTITDGGWIIAINGDRANFGGNAKVLADGTVQGQQEYQDQGPAQPMNVHSTELTATTCSDDRTMASIFGKATIDGAGSHVFKIDVTDGGAGGSNDTYGITLDKPYQSGQQPLRGGNVTIHKQ